jgi:hypothetical protein
VGYYEGIKQATRAYLATLNDTALAVWRVIPPVSKSRTVAVALGQRTWDHVAHGGQIAYGRGLFQGMGWYGR